MEMLNPITNHFYFWIYLILLKASKILFIKYCTLKHTLHIAYMLPMTMIPTVFSILLNFILIGYVLFIANYIDC